MRRYLGMVGTMVILILTTCLSDSKVKMRDDSGKILIDTLGVVLQLLDDTGATQPGINKCAVYQYLAGLDTMNLEGNDCFGELISNSVYEHGVFKEEPVTMIDSNVIFSFAEQCCHSISVIDLKCVGNKEEMTLGGNRHLFFIDKARKIIVDSGMRNCSESDEEDKKCYTIVFWSIEKRLRIKSFVLPPSPIYLIASDHNNQESIEYPYIQIILDSLNTLSEIQ